MLHCLVSILLVETAICLLIFRNLPLRSRRMYTQIYICTVKVKNDAFSDLLSDPTNAEKSAAFRAARRLLTDRLRNIKEEWWLKQSQKMQSLADCRQHREFFGCIKSIFGPYVRSANTLVDPDSNSPCTQPEDIMNLWRNHFSRLLNRPTAIDWATVNGLTQQPIRDSLSSSSERYEVRKAVL